ncbi:MAG: hypothetical protein M1352_03225 [Patescibacteria group bacterium]|nr:hypothetical protein [Patescibacteria group bacterium]
MNNTARLFLLFLFFLFIGVGSGKISLADTTEDQLKSLQEQQKVYEDKIASLQSQKKTLQNQISLMDSQINITQIKIEQAKTQIVLNEAELEKLTSDIGLVSSKIDTLGQTLDRQKSIFAGRANAFYRSSAVTPLDLVLGGQDFSYFIDRLKYLQVFELQDSKYLLQMEDTQQAFQSQKIVLGDKKDQVQVLKDQIEATKKNLEAYNQSLQTQRAEKQNLLQATASDENRYQQLLAQVIAEQAAIQRFVNLQGGASLLSNQTFCDGWGCYYNQRDSSWGAKPLGSSTLSVAEYGCLVSSSAMIASHYQKGLNPADIAANPAAFFSPDSSTAYLWKDITVNGVRILRVSLSPTTASIDSELAAGRPVIVGLYRGPAHFVVLKSGSGGNYVMDDPFVENGHDISFTSKYPLSAITEVERVTVN